MASIARLLAPRGSRGTPLSWRLRDWWENVEFSESARRNAGIAGLGLLGLFWGAMVGVAGVAGALIAVSLLACVFVMRDFRVGVIVLIAIMPISQSYIFPHAMFGITGLNPLNLLIMATLASLFMRSLGDGTWKHFLPRPLFLLYISPLLMGTIIGMYHVDKIPADFNDLELVFFNTPGGYFRDMFGKPMTLVVYALLVAAAVERSDHMERFTTPMVISVFVMAVMAIIFVLLQGVSLSQLAGTFSRHFFSAIGMHANDLGRLYVTAYALMLFMWDRTPRMSFKVTLVVGMLLVSAAMVLTMSRGAMLAFLIVNILYLLWRRQLRTLLLAAILIPIALWLAPGALYSRMTMGFGGSANEVSAGRTNEIWAPLIPELFKSPIWGDGLGSILWSQAMLEGRLPLVAHPHNAFLQVWTDMGAIGLLLIVAWWLYCCVHFRRLSKDERLPPKFRGFFQGAAVGTLAFLAVGFAGSSLAPVPAQSFMWLAVGVMFGVRFKHAAQR